MRVMRMQVYRSRSGVALLCGALSLGGCGGTNVSLLTPASTCQVGTMTRIAGESFPAATGCGVCTCTESGVVQCRDQLCPVTTPAAEPTALPILTPEQKGPDLALRQEHQSRHVTLTGKAVGQAVVDQGLERTAYTVSLMYEGLAENEVASVWLMTIEPFSVVKLGECSKMESRLSLAGSLIAPPAFDRIVVTADTRKNGYRPESVIAEGRLK